MTKLINLAFLLCINLFYCQIYFYNDDYSESTIYKLKLRLEKGDKTALNELAPYFDSRKKLGEYLGHHYLETQELYLAHRAVQENSTFTSQEIIIDSISSSKQFLDFLKKNNSKIKYSPEIQAFYITPIEQRKESVEFREFPKAKFEKLSKRIPEILQQEWANNSGVTILIEQKNPESLVKICEEFYRKRDKFNVYNHNADNLYDLLSFLIRKDIGSRGRNNIWAWNTKDFSFDNNSILNLLIYFYKNYKNFVWDDSEKYFINRNLQSEKIDNIADLFEDLYNENDASALKSYIKLSQSDAKRVGELAVEKNKNFLDRTNYAIPMFPFRFLIQLSLLTEYCQQNKIDFLGNDHLKSNIEKLSSKLSFVERRQFENKLLDSLKSEDITPLEYWTLIYQKNSNLQKSVSRILDIYYTNNWSKIISDNRQLSIYLKKSLLYDRIGINGNLNYYIYKFVGNGSETAQILSELKIEDDLKTQIQRAQKLCLEEFDYPENDKKVSDANFSSQKINIQAEVDKQRITAKDDDDFEYNVLKIFSKINYSQIPEAIKVSDKIKFKKENYRDKYSFLERDFGFFSIDNWKSGEVRNNFLSIYHSYTEKQLYEYYLDKAGIDYKNNDSSLNYDKIYEILKFDIVTPFTGSQEYENEVGAIIKILELNQKTTLGYPDKLCNSAGMYICPPSDRAWEWRKYLKDHKLLKQKHSEIVSFNYGYYLDKVLLYKSLK